MLLSPCLLPLSLLVPADHDVAPRGRYVEARTASVFAGACHYGAESTTAGREALLAWRIESGAYAGVDLGGVSLAVALADDRNLAEGPADRRAILYADARESPARQAAACAWLARAHGELLGRIEAVKSITLELRLDDSGYALHGVGAFDLVGAPLPDRACCKMPLDVWYAPCVPLESRLVGNDARFEFRDAALGAVWSRPDENAAFVGRFGG